MSVAQKRRCLSFLTTIVPCKRIQGSLGSFIPHRVFRIPSTWFQSLSVELHSGFESLVEFRIRCAVIRVPKPTIPDSPIKIFLDSRFLISTSKNFRDSGIRITIYGATTGLRDITLPQRRRQWKRHWKLTSRPLPNSENYSKIYASCRSRPRENLKVGHFKSYLATWCT